MMDLKGLPAQLTSGPSSEPRTTLTHNRGANHT